MIRIFFVRHGQTDWNAQQRWQGLRDIPLNAAGRAQVEFAARAFAGIALDRVYASDLARARETADAISRATGAEVEATPSLRERSFGLWEGRTNAEIAAEWPDQMAKYRRDRELFTPPDGQAWRDFACAAVGAVEGIAARHDGGTIAIVAHGGPIKAFLDAVLQIPRGPVNRYQLDNGSISIVQRRRHEETGIVWWQVVALNVTTHLDGTNG